MGVQPRPGTLKDNMLGGSCHGLGGANVLSTPREVAEWMSESLGHATNCSSRMSLPLPRLKGGSEFVYEADKGLPSLERRVLSRLQKLTEDDVIWQTYHGNRHKGYWCHRQLGDLPRTQ